MHARCCYIGRWSRRDIALHGVGPRVAAVCRYIAGATQTLRGAIADCVSQEPTRQATTAQRATSALQALQRICDNTGARAGRVPAVDETMMEAKDDEQDLEPDEYDASSDDADDAAYCMQPAD